ncbi:ribonuclease D [Corynebacterium yudongzhengii]|uniref:Ribonuclease D n=1 Tax=Corynebacterium yudongzhengii TaxID=2080740 RepID=A0A2U1T4W7_9CORY|nr:ribonuclease D [Corynebacterium yudongzhengii]
MKAVTDYLFIDDPADFPAAARRLTEGYGPLAVDTERAGGFRYDDRAFLVQLYRRGIPPIVVDPEGHREAFTVAFADVLEDLDWVMHAAHTDLPALQMLRVWPRRLFDTELAGRLLGLEKVNLSAMVGAFLGIDLPKGHGAEDFSQRPLPRALLDYAADDVIYLPDLVDTLAELLAASGKTTIAQQEFAHLLTFPPQPERWDTVRGAATLTAPEQRVVLEHLWHERDRIARAKDRAPTRVLATKTLVDMARRQPRTQSELRRIAGAQRLRRGHRKFWLEHVSEALSTDRALWPPRPQHADVPSKSAWKSTHPGSWEVVTALREDVAELAADIEVESTRLLKPSLLREVVWQVVEKHSLHPTSLRDYLLRRGARPWQVELVAPLLTARLS